MRKVRKVAFFFPWNFAKNFGLDFLFDLLSGFRDSAAIIF